MGEPMKTFSVTLCRHCSRKPSGRYGIGRTPSATDIDSRARI